MKKNTIWLLLLFLAGLSLLLYPTISNYWNSFHATEAVAAYREAADAMTEEQYQTILSDAQAYNKALLQKGQSCTPDDAQKKAYEQALNPDGSGVMGYIDIPSIGVELPIYHGTAASVLQTAAGHLEWTSLPVGGEGTHSVISGHRGLPSAKLFTDLDKLTIGEQFTMTVLNETMTYEVDQILTVKPEEIGELGIQKGKDLCTLMTCTPYGINTHRLLVRGHRVENMKESAHLTSEAVQIEPVMVLPFVALPLLLIAFLLLRRSDQKRVRRDNL